MSWRGQYYYFVPVGASGGSVNQRICCTFLLWFSFWLSAFVFLSCSVSLSTSVVSPSVYLCLSLWPNMCGAHSSWRRISLSAAKWLWLTGLRKAAGDRCWRGLTDWLSGYIETQRGDESRELENRILFHNSPSQVNDSPLQLVCHISFGVLVPAFPTLAATCCCLRDLSCCLQLSASVLFALHPPQPCPPYLFPFILLIIKHFAPMWPIVIWRQQLPPLSVITLLPFSPPIF